MVPPCRDLWRVRGETSYYLYVHNPSLEIASRCAHTHMCWLDTYACACLVQYHTVDTAAVKKTYCRSRSEFRWGSGSPGTSGWSRIWVFLTSASPCSLAALILNATRSDPYLMANSDTVSHRRAPRLRCVLVERISLKKLDSVQCPSHWSHCSYRTANLGEPRYGWWHAHLRVYDHQQAYERMCRAKKFWDQVCLY